MRWDDGMEDGPRCCNVGWRDRWRWEAGPAGPCNTSSSYQAAAVSSRQQAHAHISSFLGTSRNEHGTSGKISSS